MDDIEQIIDAFAAHDGPEAPAWKLDLLLDLERLQDPRIVPFLLTILADPHESREVRTEVLERLRAVNPGSQERAQVAAAVLTVLDDHSAPDLRVQAALSLGDFTDIPRVVDALGQTALETGESFDLRYVAFTSLERAGPTAVCRAYFDQLTTDEVLGRSAASLLQSWKA